MKYAKIYGDKEAKVEQERSAFEDPPREKMSNNQKPVDVVMEEEKEVPKAPAAEQKKPVKKSSKPFGRGELGFEPDPQICNFECKCGERLEKESQI